MCIRDRSLTACYRTAGVPYAKALEEGKALDDKDHARLAQKAAQHSAKLQRQKAQKLVEQLVEKEKLVDTSKEETPGGLRYTPCPCALGGACRLFSAVEAAGSLYSLADAEGTSLAFAPSWLATRGSSELWPHIDMAWRACGALWLDQLQSSAPWISPRGTGSLERRRLPMQEMTCWRWDWAARSKMERSTTSRGSWPTSSRRRAGRPAWQLLASRSQARTSESLSEPAAT